MLGKQVVPSPRTLSGACCRNRTIAKLPKSPSPRINTHTDTMAATISHDLAWEVTKGHSASLVKRANGVQLSRDPLNLRNVYSRKNEGQIANKVR